MIILKQNVKKGEEKDVIKTLLQILTKLNKTNVIIAWFKGVGNHNWKYLLKTSDIFKT